MPRAGGGRDGAARGESGSRVFPPGRLRRRLHEGLGLGARGGSRVRSTPSGPH